MPAVTRRHNDQIDIADSRRDVVPCTAAAQVNRHDAAALPQRERRQPDDQTV